MSTMTTKYDKRIYLKRKCRRNDPTNATDDNIRITHQSEQLTNGQLSSQKIFMCRRTTTDQPLLPRFKIGNCNNMMRLHQSNGELFDIFRQWIASFVAPFFPHGHRTYHRNWPL